MKVIVVDEDVRQLNLMESILSEIEELELTAKFQSLHQALAYVRELKGVPVLLFLDGELPESDVVSEAVELQRTCNSIKIVFTADSKEYAYAAWKAEAVDFLLKPYDKAGILHAVERYRSFGSMGNRRRIEARCFPDFSFFVDGNPVKFHNKKAKELLAYLVHHKGKWVDTASIVYDIFGEQKEELGKKYYHVVSYRLRDSLKEIGISGLMEFEYGKCRVRPEMFSCDYYEYLDGREELFEGDYMEQYSWAEPTVATMLEHQRKCRNENNVLRFD